MEVEESAAICDKLVCIGVGVAFTSPTSEAKKIRDIWFFEFSLILII